MCCHCVTAVGPLICTWEQQWLICLFTPLRAEGRVGLSKTLAKHPGESRELYGKQPAVHFLSSFDLKLLGQQIWRWVWWRGQGQVSAESAAQAPWDNSSTQKDCDPFWRDSKHLMATWSAQSPGQRQTVCTARGLHGWARFLLGSPPQLRSSLPSSATAPRWLWASHSLPPFPQRWNGEEDTALCWDLLASGVQEAGFENTVFISKTTPLMLPLSLQLTLVLFYYWVGIYTNKNYIAVFRNQICMSVALKNQTVILRLICQQYFSVFLYSQPSYDRIVLAKKEIHLNKSVVCGNFGTFCTGFLKAKGYVTNISQFHSTEVWN